MTVAIGCTGGKHRSVAMTEEIARRLREAGSKTYEARHAPWRQLAVRVLPASLSCRAISSVIATLRCLPPVQPIATVMNRLPSRR